MKLTENELQKMIRGSLQNAFAKNLSSIGNTNDAVTANVQSMSKMKNMAEEEVEEETGYSPFLKSKDNPKGETEGLTVDVLNQILIRLFRTKKVKVVKLLKRLALVVLVVLKLHCLL